MQSPAFILGPTPVPVTRLRSLHPYPGLSHPSQATMAAVFTFPDSVLSTQPPGGAIKSDHAVLTLHKGLTPTPTLLVPCAWLVHPPSLRWALWPRFLGTSLRACALAWRACSRLVSSWHLTLGEASLPSPYPGEDWPDPSKSQCPQSALLHLPSASVHKAALYFIHSHGRLSQ